MVRKPRFMAAVMFLFITLLAMPAATEVYRYTDSRGQLHFVDDPEKVPRKYRTQLENAKPLADVSVVNRTPAHLEHKGQKPVAKPQPAQGDENVEVFLTSWCGYCKNMVRFLNEQGIRYTAYDIEKDAGAERTYRALGGRGVPVVRIGNRVIYGYNPEAILSSLGRGK